MAATLAGEAAIRIVPSLRGFKPEADRRLKTMAFDPVNVKFDPDFKQADVEAAAWRKRQEANAINVPIRGDFAHFKRELSTVEHIFKRNSLSRALRLNVKIIGLDALPALAYAAGSATAGLDALGKSALALPGLLAGAMSSVGALAIGMRGISDAFKAYGEDAKNAASSGRDIEKSNRDIQKSYRSYSSAVRDTIREIQDLNAENRRSSLNVADAVLSVQEAADRLREGGQKSITELRRDQLSYVQAIDHLQEVQVKSQRTMADAAEANSKGVQGADQVVDALERIAEAQASLNDTMSGANTFDEQLAKLAPEAQDAVKAVTSFEGAWKKLTNSVQTSLFEDIDKSVIQLGQKSLPGLEVGLSRVASGLNKNFRGVAESLGSDVNQSFLQRIFGNTEGGLTNLSKAMNPLTEGLMRLMKESSDYLPRLGIAAEKVFGKFNNWTQKISDDGSFDTWMNQGLDALSSIGRTAGNLLSIINDVSEAFNKASGHEGGFLHTIENASTKLKDLLNSQRGKQNLVEYFEQAREFMHEIVDALQEAKPFIKDLVATAREWSSTMFTVAGAFLKVAGFIEEQTGLLGHLLMAYLTFRTVKPLIEGMTTAWQNYNKVVAAAATSSASPFQNVAGVQALHRNLQKAKGEAIATQQAVAGALTARGTTNGAKVPKGPELGPAAGGGAAMAALAAGGPRLPQKLSAEDRYNYSFNPAAMDPKVRGEIVAYQMALVESADAADRAADAAKRAQDPTSDLGNESKKTAAEAKKHGDAQKTAGQQTQTAGTSSRTTATHIASVGDASAKATPQVREVGNAADDAGNKVGNKGNTASMLSRVGGLAAGLAGPVGLTIAITTALGFIQQLGEAHRNAARDAKAQDDALKNLSTTLNNVTGAFTAQTLTDTLKEYENGVPLGGGVDSSFKVLEAMGRLGMDPNLATRVAADPKRAAEYETDQAGRYQALAAQIQGTEDYKRLKPIFDKYGLDPLTLARAAGNEQDAIDKVRAAATQDQLGGGYTDANGVPSKLPDMNAIAGFLPNTDLFGVTQVLANTHRTNATQGALNLGTSQMAGGTRELKTPIFDAWGPDRPSLTVDTTGAGHVQLSQTPSPEERQRLGDEHGITWQDDDPFTPGITAVIPTDLVDTMLPAFRDGGLVRGPGTGTSDSILARVSNNEHITQAKSVGYYGQKLFDDLNARKIPRERILGGFNGGGFPLSPPPGVDDLLGGGTGSIPGVPTAGTGFLGSLFGGLTGVTPPAAPAPAPAPAPSPLAPPAVKAATTPASASTGPDLNTSAFQPGFNYVDGMPVAPGGAAPTFTGGSYGLKPGTDIDYGAAGFPDWIYQMGSQYGVQASTYPGHQEGSGSNKGVDWVPSGVDINTPEGAARMDAFAAALQGMPNVDQVIWENPLTGQRFGKDPGDRGANQSIDDYYAGNWAGHRNHVHVRFKSGPMQGMDMASIMAATGGDPALLQQLAAGGLPTGKSGGGKDKQTPGEFLTDLAGNVGSSMLDIGLTFLQGITGLDFRQVLGPAQQIANHYLGGAGGMTGGDTAATDIAGQGISDYMGGQAGLSPELLQMLGANGMGTGDYTSLQNSGLWQPGKKGGEAYRGMVKATLAKYGQTLGITNFQAWEDALVKQIDTESGGDPFSFNGSDSNGQGGTQTVKGLLNFLPSTFDANNVTGGSINDPAAQLAAALPYVVKKWGMDENGAPKQIGQGQGFAAGGFPTSGMAFLSNGEYRTSAAATQYYGPDLFNALNARQIPQAFAKGFAEGGFPLLPPAPVNAPPGPLPGPPPAPTPAPPAPAPAPAAGPLPGPPALAPPSVAASASSTGGAPGPGATAPAPDPGATPQVTDAMSAVGGLGDALGAIGGPSSVGASQPGATGANGQDMRGTLGEAPEDMEHTHGALSAGIQGAASTIGGLAASAVQAAATAGTFGAGGQAAGGAAGSLISSGAQIVGQVGTGVANILSSLLVGTATNGSTQSASGVPLLPQQPKQTGVPVMNPQRVHNGDINVTNLDEYRRTQERIDAQQMMPFIGKFE